MATDRQVRSFDPWHMSVLILSSQQSARIDEFVPLQSPVELRNIDGNNDTFSAPACRVFQGLKAAV
jgi:hypothetical protein